MSDPLLEVAMTAEAAIFLGAAIVAALALDHALAERRRRRDR